MPLAIETNVTWEQLDQVRIVPRGSCYVVEVVYTVEGKPAAVDPNLVGALDLGVNQLAALTSSKSGFVPRLINGRPLKDMNHYYNQQRAHHQQRLAKQNRRSSHQLERLTTKRTRRVKHYLHTASRRIIDLLVNAFSDSQARPGQEIGGQQLPLAAWVASVGRILVPSCQLAV